MPLSPMDNLVRIGQLKAERPAQAELDGLIRSGRVRLTDAANATLNLESRFDLAYNAAHALSLAALRWHGYRSENRYQVLPVSDTYAGIGGRAVARAGSGAPQAQSGRVRG